MSRTVCFLPLQAAGVPDENCSTRSFSRWNRNDVKDDDRCTRSAQAAHCNPLSHIARRSLNASIADLWDREFSLLKPRPTESIENVDHFVQLFIQGSRPLLTLRALKQLDDAANRVTMTWAEVVLHLLEMGLQAFQFCEALLSR